MEFFLAVFLNGQPAPIYPVHDPFPSLGACTAARAQALVDPRGKGYVHDVKCERHRISEHFSP